VLGGQIRVPTPSGDVTMTVPPWTNSGASLRLKGKGVAASDGKRGDEFVKLTIRLPDKPDPKLKKLMSEWLSASADDERKAAES